MSSLQVRTTDTNAEFHFCFMACCMCFSCRHFVFLVDCNICCDHVIIVDKISVYPCSAVCFMCHEFSLDKFCCQQDSKFRRSR
jgi:hypothetical protein